MDDSKKFWLIVAGIFLLIILSVVFLITFSKDEDVVYPSEKSLFIQADFNPEENSPYPSSLLMYKKGLMEITNSVIPCGTKLQKSVISIDHSRGKVYCLIGVDCNFNGGDYQRGNIIKFSFFPYMENIENVDISISPENKSDQTIIFDSYRNVLYKVEFPGITNNQNVSISVYQRNDKSSSESKNSELDVTKKSSSSMSSDENFLFVTSWTQNSSSIIIYNKERAGKNGMITIYHFDNVIYTASFSLGNGLFYILGYEKNKGLGCYHIDIFNVKTGSFRKDQRYLNIYSSVEEDYPIYQMYVLNGGNHHNTGTYKNIIFLPHSPQLYRVDMSVLNANLDAPNIREGMDENFDDSEGLIISGNKLFLFTSENEGKMDYWDETKSEWVNDHGKIEGNVLNMTSFESDMDKGIIVSKPFSDGYFTCKKIENS